MMRLRGESRLLYCTVGWVALALVACVGCGPGGYRGPTGTVTGKVTLDGQPVPSGCSVSFVSEAGFTAAAAVASGGVYSLATGGTPQIPVARYKVNIAPPSKPMSDADYDKYMSGAGGGEAQASAEVIPAKYQATETSGLSFDVKEGPNTINIELKK